MEVNVVGRRQSKVAGVVARSSPESASEGPAERLRGAVAGSDRDLDYRLGTQRERGSLEQQSSAERGRRLAECGAGEPVEVEPAEMAR